MYDAAVTRHAVILQGKYPVITQDLLNMTLTRANGTKSRYVMDKKRYFLVAHASHPPLTIYAAISTDGFGNSLTAETKTRLETYRQHLSDAESEIGVMDIQPDLKQGTIQILRASQDFIKQTVSRGKSLEMSFPRM
jgi:hypothetical protein